jgi:hypothetical protein
MDEIDAVRDRVVGRLAEGGYKARYSDETAFEVDVWPRVFSLAQELGFDCLTSHAVHADRSVEQWREFCEDPRGPDVKALGANNRLDIVLNKRDVGSIGVEIKCLGDSGHAAKLTQGLGQVVLGLANRDRTVLLIHCGTAPEVERTELRRLADRICNGSRIRLVVVP